MSKKQVFILDRNVAIDGLKEIAEEVHYSERNIMEMAVRFVMFGDSLAFIRMVVEPRGSQCHALEKLHEWVNNVKYQIEAQFWMLTEDGQRWKLLYFEMDSVSYSLTVEAERGKKK